MSTVFVLVAIANIYVVTLSQPKSSNMNSTGIDVNGSDDTIVQTTTTTTIATSCDPCICSRCRPCRACPSCNSVCYCFGPDDIDLGDFGTTTSTSIPLLSRPPLVDATAKPRSNRKTKLMNHTTTVAPVDKHKFRDTSTEQLNQPSTSPTSKLNVTLERHTTHDNTTNDPLFVSHFNDSSTITVNFSVRTKNLKIGFDDVFGQTIMSLRQKLQHFTSHWEVSGMIEVVTAIFFTFELSLRLFSCPAIVRFCRKMMNIFDTALVLMQTTRCVLVYCNRNETDDLKHIAYEILLYFQIFRVVRLFRIFENVKAFKVLKFSIRIGAKDLCVMLMYVVVATVIIGNFVYFFESDDDFSSIPAAYYWTIITMTTVGYGDMYPKTTVGE